MGYQQIYFIILRFCYLIFYVGYVLVFAAWVIDESFTIWRYIFLLVNTIPVVLYYLRLHDSLYDLYRDFSRVFLIVKILQFIDFGELIWEVYSRIDEEPNSIGYYVGFIICLDMMLISLLGSYHLTTTSKSSNLKDESVKVYHMNMTTLINEALSSDSK